MYFLANGSHFTLLALLKPATHVSAYWQIPLNRQACPVAVALKKPRKTDPHVLVYLDRHACSGLPIRYTSMCVAGLINGFILQPFHDNWTLTVQFSYCTWTRCPAIVVTQLTMYWALVNGVLWHLALNNIRLFVSEKFWSSTIMKHVLMMYPTVDINMLCFSFCFHFLTE